METTSKETAIRLASFLYSRVRGYGTSLLGADHYD
jgi:hypothetical protein